MELDLSLKKKLSIDSEKKKFKMENIQRSLKGLSLTPNMVKSICDLPDEVILQILENLDMKSLANCVTVSKRIRAICGDVTKFQKINLFAKKVPRGFVQLVLNSGCKYLSLYSALMKEEASGLCLNNASRLIYLDLSFFCGYQSYI